MNLNNKHFVIIITTLLFSCAEKPKNPTKIQASQIAITNVLSSNDTITNFVTPYRNRINKVLDSTLAYVAKDLVKDDGDRNTSAGNFLADAVFAQANPIFASRTNNNIDFVVLNHGGIRAIVSKGNVNARTAYQIMPFENNIVIVEMNGSSVKDMLSFLAKSGRPHPVANTKLVLDKNGNYLKTEINGTTFDKNRTYYVATNDYLVQGGDDMGFFKNRTSITNLDYLVRNAIIDYFKKVDTITTTVDDRFIQLK